MKQLALYIILFCYSIVILKPVSPYVTDAVEHIFHYTQHMATVHYENGKYHVHKELVAAEKKDNSSKQLPSAKKYNSANDHIFLLQKKALHISPAKIKYSFPSFAKLADKNCAAIYPPPRA